MLKFRIQYNGNTRARLDLFAKLQALGPDYHRAKPQGDAIYRVSNDVWGLFGILAVLIDVAAAVVRPVAMTGIMLSRNVTITLIAWSAAPMLMLANFYFSRTLKRTATETKRVDTDFTTVLQRAVSSVSLSQLFGRQSYEKAKFDRAARRSVKALLKFNWQDKLYPLTVQTIFSLWGAAVFGYGALPGLSDPQDLPRRRRGRLHGLPRPVVGPAQPDHRLQGRHPGPRGLGRARLPRAGPARDRPGRPDAVHLAVRPRTLTLHDVGFRYAPTPTRCCAASAPASRPGRWSRSSAPAAPARARC